jgi:hypothetical protein
MPKVLDEPELWEEKRATKTQLCRLPKERRVNSKTHSPDEIASAEIW